MTISGPSASRTLSAHPSARLAAPAPGRPARSPPAFVYFQKNPASGGSEKHPPNSLPPTYSTDSWGQADYPRLPLAWSPGRSGVSPAPSTRGTGREKEPRNVEPAKAKGQEWGRATSCGPPDLSGLSCPVGTCFWELPGPGVPGSWGEAGATGVGRGSDSSPQSRR